MVSRDEGTSTPDWQPDSVAFLCPFRQAELGNRFLIKIYLLVHVLPCRLHCHLQVTRAYWRFLLAASSSSSVHESYIENLVTSHQSHCVAGTCIVVINLNTLPHMCHRHKHRAGSGPEDTECVPRTQHRGHQGSSEAHSQESRKSHSGHLGNQIPSRNTNGAVEKLTQRGKENQKHLWEKWKGHFGVQSTYSKAINYTF